jgi:hypothetical protein
MSDTTRLKKGKYMTYEIRDGILYSVFIKNVLIDMPAAEIIVNERLELCNGKNYPTLFEYDNFEYADKEVRNYMNTEGIRGMSAGAIVTKSLTVKTFFNFYVAVSKPAIPAKVFTDREKAIAWLSQFIEK